MNQKYLKKTYKILKDIKSIKIQGASKVELAVKEAFLEELKDFSENKDFNYFFKLSKKFWNCRPTEPAVKNFLIVFLEFAKKNINYKNKLINFVEDSINNQTKAIDKITKFVNKEIKDEVIVFTHCHSNIVENSIKELNKYNKIKFVVNTETRPLYQGRITSKNIAKLGIKVYHVIDSSVYALASYLISKNEKIVFLSGSDVISKNGDLVNKIGTSQISLCLNNLGIKHYVLTTSSKVAPYGINYDSLDDVEIRKPKEIWLERNKKIDVINYCFDITNNKLIYRIISEKGIFKPKEIVKIKQYSKKEKEYYDLLKE